MQARVTKPGLWLMRRRARQTLAWCSGAARILEIGPGRGVFAAECIARKLFYVAIDQSLDVLKRLPCPAHTIWHRVPPLLPEKHLLRQTPLDAVVAEAVLEHMAGYADTVALVQSIHRVVRPGGRVVLRFPEIRFSRFAFWEFAADHQYVTSLPRVCALLEQNGFVVERSGYFVDCFCGPAAHLIGWLTRLIPTRMLQTVAFWATGGRKNIWAKLGEKSPQAYVVAVKPEKTDRKD